jgi:cell division protein FtsI/penicillin-binding protein 2
MARRLFPVVADDGRLGFHAEGLLRNDADSGRVPRLVASPFQLDLEVNEPIFRKFELAQAGIGQGVAASPLAMATAAASVALGELISPRLLSTTVRQARMPLIAAPPGMEQQRDALLAQLRQGMYGVVNVAGGTMYNNRLQVRPLKKKGIRFWAKTGTLTLDKDTKTYAAWLIGWAEAPDSRRVAFACLIAPSTHYGGEECGPVVAQTLAKALEPTP